VVERLFKAEQLFRKLVFPALHVERVDPNSIETKNLPHKTLSHKDRYKDTIETKSSSKKSHLRFVHIKTSQCSCFSCLVKSAWNKPALFAEKLQLAMKVKLQRNVQYGMSM